MDIQNKLKDLKKFQFEHEKRMKELNEKDRKAKKRFPLHILMIFISTLPLIVNEYYKTCYPKYWIDNTWIPICSLIVFLIFIITTFIIINKDIP